MGRTLRNNCVFFILAVFTSILFSCDFQLPTALEIRGNPELKFTAKMDIGAAFADLIDLSGNIVADVYECRGVETRTYMLRQTFDDSGMTFPPGSGTFPVSPDYDLGTNTANVSVNFDGIINDFTLQPAIARVFVDGNPELLSRLIVDITVTYSVGGVPKTFQYSEFNVGPSGVLSSIISGAYSGTSLPGNPDTNIPLPLDAVGLQIEFKVSLRADTYNLDWFNEGLSSEILVWVPLVFTANSDTAKIDIPSGTLFPDGDDLFGRDSDDSNPLSDFIESLELSIVLKKNPFDGGELVITSDGDGTPSGLIEIKHRMTGNAFSFPIDEKTMKKLNDPSTIPFAPNFTIKYKKNDRLVFPWDLSSTSIIFKAKINHRMEF